MVGLTNFNARTEYINALIAKPWTNHNQSEFGDGSSISSSDALPKLAQLQTVKQRKHRRQTIPLPVDIRNSTTVLNDLHQRDSTLKGNSTQRQHQQHRQASLDSVVKCCCCLNAPSPRITVEKMLLHECQSHRKEHSNRNHEQNTSVFLNTSLRRNHHQPIPSKRKTETVECSDDWASDYSIDWEPDTEETSKAIDLNKTLQSETKALYNNSKNLVPSDPEAFEIEFCHQRQAAIDNMTYRTAVDSWKAKDLHEVVELILELSFGKSLIDRAWIVFYWVCQNIEYDAEAYFNGDIRNQTSEDVFANRKGVCDAFGTIFEALCTGVQIECKKISGYTKGFSFQLKQATFPRTNHIWNVVRLDGHRYLVDPTWGEGHFDDNKCNRKELDSFYFLARPEQMIYKHLPEDPQWQLLTSPISMKDFLRLPFLYPIFFELELDLIFPRHSNMISFNSSVGYTEVLLRTPPDTILKTTIEPIKSHRNKSNSLIQYDAGRQLWQCLFAPQHGGFHKLTVFARRRTNTAENQTSDTAYSCAIQFGLQVPTGFRGTKIFPIIYDLFTERRCQIFEPLNAKLKPGSKVTIRCRIPAAYCARLQLDGNWLPEIRMKNDTFRQQFIVPKQEVILYVQFSDKQNDSNYDVLLKYSLNTERRQKLI